MNVGDCLYRYEEVGYSPGCDQFDNPYPGCNLRVELRKYRIARVTPCGVWIDTSYSFGDPVGDKFILLSANKRFACPTLEEAAESFKARKRRQIQILSTQLKRVQTALDIAEKGIDNQRSNGVFIP